MEPGNISDLVVETADKRATSSSNANSAADKRLKNGKKYKTKDGVAGKQEEGEEGEEEEEEEAKKKAKKKKKKKEKGEKKKENKSESSSLERKTNG